MERADVTVHGALSAAERADARRRGVVGEIGGRLFDADGRHRPGPVYRRLVAMSLDQLRAVPLVIGSVYGAARARAVRAAVRGGLVDVLVLDSPVADALLATDPPYAIRALWLRDPRGFGCAIRGYWLRDP